MRCSFVSPFASAMVSARALALALLAAACTAHATPPYFASPEELPAAREVHDALAPNVESVHSSASAEPHFSRLPAASLTSAPKRVLDAALTHTPRVTITLLMDTHVPAPIWETLAIEARRLSRLASFDVEVLLWGMPVTRAGDRQSSAAHDAALKKIAAFTLRGTAVSIDPPRAKRLLEGFLTTAKSQRSESLSGREPALGKDARAALLPALVIESAAGVSLVARCASIERALGLLLRAARADAPLLAAALVSDSLKHQDAHSAQEETRSADATIAALDIPAPLLAAARSAEPKASSSQEKRERAERAALAALGVTVPPDALLSERGDARLARIKALGLTQ